MTQHEEFQYLHLVRTLLERGHVIEGRNGTTRSLFGHSMRFSLRHGTLPLLTTKRVAYKTCLKELLWFLRGETDNRLLQEQDVHIWDGNASRAFLDSRGLHDYPEGILGPIYGFQWRHFGAEYVATQNNSAKTEYAVRQSNSDSAEAKYAVRQNNSDSDSEEAEYVTTQSNSDSAKAEYVATQNNSNSDSEETEYVATDEHGPPTNPATFAGIDQLAQVIHQLRHDRQSRRILMTAWNPMDLDKMALPPCHVMAQFHVRDNRFLSCALFQRSCDVGLGVPFNIASYSLMTHLLAKHCGLEAEEFVYFMGNVHIYENHVNALQQQSERVPVHTFPTISIDESVATKPVEEWNEMDIVFTSPYQYQSAIKMDMVA